MSEHSQDIKVRILNPEPFLDEKLKLGEIKHQIESGEFPNLDCLAVVLESPVELPSSIRDFLARFIRGEIKRPKGAPPKYKTFEDRVTELRIVLQLARNIQYFNAKEELEEKPPGTAFELAVEKTYEDLREEFEEISLSKIQKLAARKSVWRETYAYFKNEQWPSEPESLIEFFDNLNKS